ncbi:30S ribosomal protein S4 [Candidatus Fermentibacterales bacterium]|nr:30S ribosomal protein S4 [Candidatus Fermentibacterales bacterium]
MSRYLGPRLRKIRSLGVALPGLSRKQPGKRTGSPGEQGTMRRRRRMSTYRLQLAEKQKIRFNYGLSERQLHNVFQEAARMPGETGVNMLQLLERRLDSVVARAGFAPTIPAARQLVSHGHVTVNGRKVNIASARVRVGDVVSLREKSRNLKSVEDQLIQGSGMGVPSFLEVDAHERRIRVASLPAREDVALDVQERMVVEFYSR